MTKPTPLTIPQACIDPHAERLPTRILGYKCCGRWSKPGEKCPGCKTEFPA